MGTPEGKVKAFIDKKMKQWYPDAFRYAPPGGRFGKAGMPDRIWILKITQFTSLVVAIEAKVEGKGPTDLQTKTLIDLMGVGAMCAVVAGKDEDLMERIHAEIDSRLRMATQKS